LVWSADLIGELFAWWLQQLRELLPSQRRHSRAAQVNGLVVEVETLAAAGAPTATLTLRRKGRVAALGRFVLDEAAAPAVRKAISVRRRTEPVIVQVPPGLLLDREVTLPSAAERAPARVLQYEMDRLTPFGAEDVFWDWSIERRDRDLGRLKINLRLVPKAPLSPLFAVLLRLGAAPTAVQGLAADGGERWITLARPPSRVETWEGRVTAACALACVGLAVAATVLPFVRQSLAERKVEARIAALRPRVAEAEQLRLRLARMTAGGDALATEHARLGDPLQVLATLTDYLPDDTFLTELVLRQRKLTLNGQSASAAKLIAALSASAVIRNPEFIAPVTRPQISRGDQFSIAAEFAP
jgi:general secretion pathway protein L